MGYLKKYLTWEIEHINTDVLEELEAQGFSFEVKESKKKEKKQNNLLRKEKNK